MGDIGSSSGRRMGPVGSDTWNLMLDGAETILREEGHAALTSRRVAEVIGVKQRLVYYYFRTMEELIIETFRRLATRETERMQRAIASDRPVREVWDVCIHTSDARMNSEFMALANRIDGLRSQVVDYIETTRKMQISVVSEAIKKRSKSKGTDLPASVLSLLATSVALMMTRETQLGISLGHQDVMEVIERMLFKLEPNR